MIPVLPTLLALCCAGEGPSDSSDPPEPQEQQWKLEREAMVRRQIAAREVENPRVLAAMRSVLRHRFVPEKYRSRAYEDSPLPIGNGQTISQPYMVAVMTELLDPQPGDKILEIGTGSGYQAAVLSRLVDRVYTIEIVPELAENARRALLACDCANVEVITGDGYRGLPEYAPYDGILVTAAPAEVPEPLIEQLAVGGRLVIPVGTHSQVLRVLERTQDGIATRDVFGVRFVPFTGEAQKRSGRWF
jgi:protein-L-isoaspartate(D-aspartate) O-methyltransferase